MVADPMSQTGYLRIAAEEAFAPPEILDRYRKLIEEKSIDDPGFVSLMGFYLGSSPRAVQVMGRMTDLDELRIRDMDATGIASCDLLGTSHGGAVSMILAALAPERIRRLILVDPVNPWSAHGKHLSVLLSNPLVGPIFLKLAPRVRILDEFYHRRMFGDPRRIPPDSLEGYRKPMRIPGSYEYGLAVLRSWNRDLRELELVLPLIADIPTLLIWGTSDTAVDPASAHQLQERLHDCRLLMFEGVGHLPYEEAPEEFNRAVTAFLSANSH